MEQDLKNYPNKTEKVYQIVKNGIVGQNLTPGQRLVERELAQELGVSKTPIREALGRLKKEGLVGGTSYKGFFVAKISAKDMEEIYKLREMLEGLAARETAGKINDKQLKGLRSLIQSLQECIESKDLETYSSFDLEFHNQLATISGNSRLFEIMQLLRAQTRVLMSSSVMLPGRARASLQEHKRIIDAIASRKPSLAEKFAREHIREVQEAVLAPLNREEKNEVKS